MSSEGGCGERIFEVFFVSLDRMHGSLELEIGRSLHLDQYYTSINLDRGSLSGN
jgi:hypothetical protein